MATATLGGTSRKLTPEQIAARKQAAAVAELERNGIQVPIERPRHALPALAPMPPELNGIDVAIPLAPLPPEPRNFQSRDDAKPMAKADVQNVEPLTTDENEALLRRLEISHPKLYADLIAADDELWGTEAGWDEDDSRWALTPHAVRKLQRKAV